MTRNLPVTIYRLVTKTLRPTSEFGPGLKPLSSRLKTTKYCYNGIPGLQPPIWHQAETPSLPTFQRTGALSLDPQISLLCVCNSGGNSIPPQNARQ